MPLINRVGGGGVDPSGVTVTAGKVWEGYSFIGADGEIDTGEIPAYNNEILWSNTDELKSASKFSSGDGSADGINLRFKVNETKILTKDAEISVMLYKSVWDAAYGQTVATGLTGDVTSRKIRIPVENAELPRYFSLTAMSGIEAFSDAGTYEIVSMQYNQASDDYAWAVRRKKSDGSFDTVLLDVTSTLTMQNSDGELSISINSSTYSFVGNNQNLYKYSYIVVW